MTTHCQKKYGITLTTRVKSSNFGQWVKSDIHLLTVKIQMRRRLRGRHIRTFTVRLVNSFLYSNDLIGKKHRCLNLVDCPDLPDFTIRQNTLYSVIHVEADKGPRHLLYCILKIPTIKQSYFDE